MTTAAIVYSGVTVLAVAIVIVANVGVYDRRSSTVAYHAKVTAAVLWALTVLLLT